MSGGVLDSESVWCKLVEGTMMLRITKCTDPLMWYAGMVGEKVPLLKIHDDCYLSREPAGYTNIVKFEDAEILEAP